MVIFLDRQRWQVYIEKPEQVLSLDLPSNLVRDLEVLNTAGLKELLINFLKQNKLVSGEAVCVLSSEVIFNKKFPLISEDEQQTQEQQFLETLPFEAVLTKRIPGMKEYELFAVNRDLVRKVRSTLEDLGFQLKGFVLFNALGPLQAKRWLDVEIGRYVAKNTNLLLTNGAIERKVEVEPSGLVLQAKPTNPFRQYTLIAVFGILIVIMIVMFVLMPR